MIGRDACQLASRPDDDGSLKVESSLSVHRQEYVAAFHNHATNRRFVVAVFHMADRGLRGFVFNSLSKSKREGHDSFVMCAG